MEFWKKNCPIVLLEEKLMEAGHLLPAEKVALESEIAKEMAANFKFAKEGSFPGKPMWQQWNWNETSPAADKLLELPASGEFDHHQADAKLAPY
jgi:TPP-dependent pyruvate/acetoin dehydrogenase alpha subunit